MADSSTPRAIKWASLPNSLELPYVEQGDESGSPVVFLHAYADSWRSFEPVLSHLPRSIHAFAPTQRGHSNAGRPAAGYNVEDFAHDLEAFMDVVGLEQAVLVASSSATFTVQRLAIDNPHRTRGLVLIGVPWSLRDTAVGSELPQAVFALSDPVDPAFVRDFVASTVFGPVSPAFLETVIGESLKVPRKRNTSAEFAMCSCHQDVSVRAGKSATTMASSEVRAFATHLPISRPYGGLRNTFPRQGSIKPSSLRVKYVRALTGALRRLCVGEQGSRSKVPKTE